MEDAPSPQSLAETPSDLREKLELALARASNAERRLEAAKSELLLLSQSPAEKAPEPKENEELGRLKAENADLLKTQKNLELELQSRIEATEHWRLLALKTELDNTQLAGKAALATDMLHEVVQPLPHDAQKLVDEREMIDLALSDKLTGLANENRLDIALQETIAQAQYKDELAALLLINVDGFQGHNEFLGWETGNELLVQVGKRLRAKLPEDTTLARRGADNFAVLTTIQRATGQAATIETPLVKVRQIADFLLGTLAAPFEIAGQKIPLRCSVGLSVYPDDADTPDEMLENAHAALAAAKKAGGGQYALYNDGIYAEKELRAGLATELKAVVEANGLCMLYRPVVDSERGSLAAAIVEPFWEHSEHGRVGQFAFFPIAEERGVAHHVVSQIVTAGCEVSRKLRGSIPTILRLPSSVLRQADFIKGLLAATTQARIKPESLIVQLPAEALTKTPENARALFNELARWRIGRCVGQIGNGPLDLRSLQSCPLTLLSLADELMENVPSHESGKLVVQAHLDIAKRLGLPVHVGGTADNSQAHFLALHEAKFVSGNFLSPSLNLTDFVSRRRATWKLR